MKQQYSINNDIILEIVAKIVPHISDQKIQIFDDGWDHIVIVINNKLAFRFPRREDYAKTLHIEVNFLKQFAKRSPITIPKLKYTKDKETGIFYVTYNFIPGIQFTRDISKTFSKEELLVAAKQLSLFLTTIHSFSIEKAKQLGVQQIDSFKSWEKRFIKIKKEVFPHISKKEQQWVIHLFEEFLKVIKKVPINMVLTHSDIMPEHIIVDPKIHKLSGIIDFGDISIDDPAYDFAFLAHYGQVFLDEVYKNYGLPQDTKFEIRRQFYENIFVVTNLEHSIKLADIEKIPLHKKQLSEYVELHL